VAWPQSFLSSLKSHKILIFLKQNRLQFTYADFFLEYTYITIFTYTTILSSQWRRCCYLTLIWVVIVLCSLHYAQVIVLCSPTFYNISVILRWSVLLVKETGVLGENHWPAASHWQTLLFIYGRRVRHRMVVGFTTTYAISTYQHLRCEFESRSGEVNVDRVDT
jgi:hypothetical protein